MRYPKGRTAALTLLVLAVTATLITGRFTSRAEAAAATLTSPAVTAVSRSTDKLDVFGVDAGQRIYTAAWEPDFTDGWHRWSQINGGMAAKGTSVYGVSRRTDYLDVFAVGTDLGVYTAAWQPSFGASWRGWWRLGTLKVRPNTSVHAVSSRTDRLDIFAVGEDGQVYTTGWDPSTGWAAWTKLTNGVSMAANTTVFGVSRSSGLIDIFAVDYWRHPVTNAYDPAVGWKGWRTFEDYIYVNAGQGIYPVSRSRDKIDVFTRNHLGQVMTSAWEPSFGAAWSRFRPIGDGKPVGGTQVYATVRAPDFIDVFAVGSDANVYTAAWEPSFGADWHGWWQIGDTISPGTSVYGVSRSRDHLDVFGINKNTGTYTAAWEPSFGADWHGWWPIGSNGQAGSTTAEVNANIDFNNGVTVNGWARLRVSSGGAYVFEGHFHDSGLLSYNVGLVWVIALPSGKAFTFSTKGTLHGTLESGSRNKDWYVAGANPEIEANWAEIASAGVWTWRAKTSLNVGSILSELLTGVLYVFAIDQVIQVVA
jgi:hypothetical protein